MRQESAVALGKAEAERWVMDRSRSGRSAAGAGKAVLDVIQVTAEQIAGQMEGKQRTSKAAEWLLDNLHLVQRIGKATVQSFRGGRDLPVVCMPEHYLRTVQMARSALRDLEDVEEEALLDYVTGVQEICTLTEDELMLLVPGLQLELLKQLEGAALELKALQEMPDDAKEADLEGKMAYIFTAFHKLNAADFSEALERQSKVDRALRRDPSGVYPRMDRESRRRYRAQVSRLARKQGIEEEQMAQQAVTEALEKKTDVGSVLFTPPKPTAGSWYVALIMLPAIFLSLLISLWLNSWWGGLLLFLPLTDILKNLLDFLAVKIARPRYVFRLELEDGVPPEGRTICVIAALLTGPESGRELARKLERYYLANRGAGEEVRYGILADLPDSAKPMGPEEQSWVERTKAAVAQLNETYPGQFYLFFRRPQYQPREERYLGWERKRGALLELARFLRAVPSGLKLLEGKRSALAGTRYLLTLDSDTALNVDAARRMIGAMLHPMNQPQIDAKRKVITAGYGILQPRTAVSLTDAGKTRFARVMAGQGGLDPYGCVCSDVYHDLFDRGTFTGKGILDVEAFHTCMEGRFPENRVLSHDLLEGAYLHAGLISDVELTDGFPARCGSYYRRLHRWVRGDWQASPWLFRKVRTASGEKEPNPLPPLDRWKLLDNLRRSLVPVFLLAALLAGICCSGAMFAAGAVTAVLAIFSALLLSGANLFFDRGRGCRRFHSVLVTGFTGTLVRTAVQLLLLPVQAWICLSAAVTALWRMLVSKRNLLEWVTAAQSDRKSGKVEWSMILPGVAVGLTAMVFHHVPLGGVIGLLWLLSPLLIHWLSQPIPKTVAVREKDQAFLLHEASLIWRYFEDNLNEENHYLPPDNVQEFPVPDVAHRTSPTNIGMALLSCLSAWDLGLTEERPALMLLSRMLDTVEELPKWRGHLYNWYDTRSAQPMEPLYVSTVDSGNLCGCLIALSEGLKEKGQPELSARAKALADAMAFAPLYDQSRNLFYIGYSCTTGRYSESWYDLMASEARLSSYIATARGDVRVRHWARLNRSLVGRRRYCGMVSWSGTMFEYFMPQLLLPSPVDSMIYETLCFCVCVQMEWGESKRIPWGVSESAFHALDAGDHYRYKAHGIPTLGLKRDLEQDLVVAPYAAFLTLNLVPRAAVKNLKWLRALGAAGKYGLYEAVDFTPERSNGQKNGVPVRSWMAHHLGMSLVAIDNALQEQCMVRRFLSDPAMGAYQELLQEKIPVTAPILEGQSSRQQRRSKMMKHQWEEQGKGNDTKRPACHLLSNGSYSVLLTGDGGGWSQCDGIRLTNNRDGIAVMIRTGDQIVPVFPAGQCGDQLQWKFGGDRAEFRFQGAFFTAEETVCVSASHNGELRRFQIHLEELSEDQEVLVYFRPVLTRQSSYLAHPAFSSLSVMTFGIPNGAVFRKLDEPDRVLSVKWNAKRASWTTNRFHAVNGVEWSGGPKAGTVLDPCLLLRIPAEGAHLEFQLAMTYEPLGESKRAVQSVLASGLSGAADLHGQLAEWGKQWTAQPLQLSQLISRLLVPEPNPYAAHTRGQEALWPFGISGDDPILAAVVQETELEWCSWLALQHSAAARLGFGYDLVYLLPSEGAHSMEQVLCGNLAHLRLAEEIGARGGIHMVLREQPGTDAILSYANVVLQGPTEWKQPDCPDLEPAKPYELPQAARSPEWSWTGTAFQICTHGGLLPVRWSHVLANEQFGWMADEAGTGHMWYLNTHENRLTPWQNDPLADTGPESLTLLDGSREMSLFAARDGLETEVTYGLGYGVWRKTAGDLQVELTAFVPPDCAARVFLIRCQGGKRRKLRWTITGRLSDRETHSRFVQGTTEGNCLLLRNPANTLFPGQTMVVTASEECSVAGDNPYEVTCALGERIVLVAGAYRSEEERGRILALLEGSKAEEALEQTKMWWRQKASPLEIQTPDRALNHYINSWALYQVIACRLFGRSGLYQCGGGYGFRDQLQDICALIPTEPELARAQILRCCAHQFEEGDVQHWWHPEGTDLPERGVRTRISDDLLWLPYAVSLWVQCYGDDGLLGMAEPFLRSPVLGTQERERYERPERSDQVAPVYDHCVRAIECVLARGVGEHGLCRIGTGDWNDGMNRIGEKGWGESVWLTWFLAEVLELWAEVARRKGQVQEAARYQSLSRHFAQQADSAWDGAWYLRGYDDDGQPFGGRGNAECEIDSIAQSFSVFAPHSDRERSDRAVSSALERLWDRDSGTVALLAPPFAGLTDPGYIRNYPPGVRENGGQYTHGAIWLARACYRLGRNQEGYELLWDLLPETHDAQQYLAEPYVLAGDVSMADGQLGRGGWSWYTGAAGWYYRTVQEELLGLTLREGLLTIRPHLPEGWKECHVIWHLPQLELEITVVRGTLSGILLDDMPAREQIDCRQLEGKHRIRVTLSEAESE